MAVCTRHPAGSTSAQLAGMSQPRHALGAARSSTSGISSALAALLADTFPPKNTLRPARASAGGMSSALAALLAGATHAFLPRYSPAALLSALQHYKVTATIAVPTMLHDLLAAASVSYTHLTLPTKA